MLIPFKLSSSLTKLKTTVLTMKQQCPICKSERVVKLLNWARGYNIHKCNHCKVIYTHPLPPDEELYDFYQGFFYNKPDKSKVHNEVRKRKAELLRLFGWESSADISNKRFLDFGGGAGIATKAAKELGLDAHYFDIDEESVSFVRNELEIANDRIFTDTSEIQANKFDFVFSDNAIEHDKSPIEFVSRLYTLLKPNGVLIIKTPHASNTETMFYPRVNLVGYLLRSFKYNNLKNSIHGYVNRWWHCDPPRHIYSFSKESFQEILNTLKIRTYEIDYYHIPLFKYSIVEFLFSEHRKPREILIKMLLLPLLPVELILKLAQLLLTKLRAISPGGIILKVKR